MIMKIKEKFVEKDIYFNAFVSSAKSIKCMIGQLSIYYAQAVKRKLSLGHRKNK